MTDTGIGIPEAELQHIGKRFHRITTEGGRSHEGTGIGNFFTYSFHHTISSSSASKAHGSAGLALVFELVHLHGGTTVVESQLGKGAPSTVFFPLLPVSPHHWVVAVRPSVHPSVCDVLLSTTHHSDTWTLPLGAATGHSQQRKSRISAQSTK